MDDQLNPPPPAALRFDIRTLLWVTAVIASSVGTFPPYGLWFAGAVLLLWWQLFAFKKSWARGVLPSLVAGALLFILLLPAIQAPRGGGYRLSSPYRLRQQALGLRNHSDHRGTLPDVGGRDGTPAIRSNWRVAILPYIEQGRLHSNLQLDEPWDSPANALLGAQDLEAYEFWEAESAAPGMTGHFAVVGKQTLWRPGKPRSLKEEDVPDGIANTVMLIEDAPTVPWAKPEDLSFDEAVALLTSPIDPRADWAHTIDPGFFYLPTVVRHVAWADGSVTAITGPLSEERARAILTADGGEPPWQYDRLIYLKPKIDYGRCVSLAVFVLATLAPLPRLIGRRPPNVSGLALAPGNISSVNLKTGG